MRRLPLRLPPAEGESFASYVDRLASTLLTTRGEILRRTGFGSTANELLAFGWDMTRAQRTRFAHSTGLDGSEVDQLVLHHYAEVLDLDVPALSDRDGLRSLYTHSWIYFSGSHFCPRCLAEDEGAWQLTWKLPWHFLCLRHRLLLLDRCPECSSRAASARTGRMSPAFLGVVPKLGRCMNSGRLGRRGAGGAAQPCGASLTEVSAVSVARYRRLIARQEALLQVLNGENVSAIACEVEPSVYFHELRSLSALALYAGEAEDLPSLPPEMQRVYEEHIEARGRRVVDQRRAAYSKTAPTSAALMAAALAIAEPIARSASPREAVERIRPFAERLADKARWTMFSAPVMFGFSAALTNIWQQATSHRRILTSKGLRERGRATHTQLRLDPRNVPQSYWPDSFDHQFRPLLPDVNPDRFRRYCSIALFRLADEVTWSDAARLLDLGDLGRIDAIRHITSRLRSSEHTEIFIARLFQQADEMQRVEAPIDYAVRRQAMGDTDPLPQEQWAAICTSTGCGDSEKVRRSASAWLWSAMTGNDFRLAPALRGGHFRDGYLGDCFREFHRRDLPTLKVALVGRGREYLRKRIGDERLAYEEPSPTAGARAGDRKVNAKLTDRAPAQ